MIYKISHSAFTNVFRHFPQDQLVFASFKQLLYVLMYNYIDNSLVILTTGYLLVMLHAYLFIFRA